MMSELIPRGLHNLSRTTARAVALDRSRGALAVSRAQIITAVAHVAMLGDSDLASVERATVAGAPEAAESQRYLRETAVKAMGYQIFKLGIDL